MHLSPLKSLSLTISPDWDGSAKSGASSPTLSLLMSVEGERTNKGRTCTMFTKLAPAFLHDYRWKQREEAAGRPC